MATPYLTNPPSLSASHRRIPPPCWSQQETSALIDAYCNKWYSLQRGNLRATHWEEVSDEVANTCHVASRKTSIQCRHKMEKLKKRYRGEVSRAAVRKGQPYFSSWVHFKQMDLMEKGSLYSDPNVDLVGHDSDQDEEEEEENGFRVKIPDYPFSKPSYGSGQGLRTAEYRSGVVVVNGDDDPKMAMVVAIKRLGDVYVRTEKMRMDTVKEVELMRMEMDMKRTQMILESQERLVDSFSNERLDKKKNKKIKRMMPTL